MTLSREQQNIAENHNTNTCILAGAGSGKTRTLVHLIVNDIISGVPPEQIIAFTFTHKAADELLARVFTAVKAALPDTVLDGMFIGTIHSWCLKYLQESDEFINFSSLDELQLNALTNRLYDKLNLSSIYGGTFPVGVDEFLKDLEVYFNENLSDEYLPENIKDSILAFKGILYQNKLLTYGDMIGNAINLLGKSGPIPNLSSLYVDEYQDVNPAQVTLVKAMVNDSTKLTVVGDDLQCIYNWRGSDVARILSFEQEFANAQSFRLNTNYRSDPAIVEFTSKIVETIKIRDKEKVLIPGKSKTEGKNVFWLTTDSERHQAETIADIIERYLSQGIQSNHIAILLRSVSHSGPAIVDELERRGIPVQCPLLGRGGRFTNNFIIPIFQWLSIDQSKQRNEHEEEEIIELSNLIWANAQEYLNVSEDIFWQAINTWIEDVEANSSAAYNVRNNLYTFFESVGISASETNPAVTVSLGLVSQIIRSVEEIHRRRIEGIDRKTARGIISECYHALINFQDSFGESSPLITEFNGVVVTTVHQSKGLEWPIVLLPELNRNRFPARSRGHETSFPDNVASRYGTTLEDEKRLFYVAASRAKSKLFLFSNHVESKIYSKFLKDLVDTQSLTPHSGLLTDTDLLFELEDKSNSDESLKIGLADLLIYMECPFQYGLRRIVNIQPPVGDELGFGKGLHELIQRRFVAESEWSDKELEAEIAANISLPLMSKDGEAKSKAIIQDRFEGLRDLGLFEKEVVTETKVTVYLTNAVINGQIDGVMVNPDESLTILDWKSTIHKEFLNRYKQQLKFYAYALRHQNKTVKDALLIDVGKSNKEGKLCTTEIDTQEEEINSFISDVKKALIGIKSHSFPAHSSPTTCPSCDMQKICKYKYQ